jgi:hypothetical protein
MKRKAKPKLNWEHGPDHHYSLFSWELCSACHKEFRREWGWRFLGPPYIGGAGIDYYLCKVCAPSKDAAVDLVLQRIYIAARPTPPPMPPRKSGVLTA